jgi:uncharacterized protein YyaL (SSP411 family)
MANRLANEVSPYLRQHGENPVDWYPWGEEAFLRAKLEDKPIFLSVGYSSCHWCHVMEEESFEDARIAALLNESFVSIKVDREERPDVDEAYMTAVQLTSGRGGWPMSVFLTPDRRPFFAGTYFPPTDLGQHPGFATVLAQLAQTWRQRRADVEKAATEIASALRQTFAATPPGTFSPLDHDFVDRGLRQILSDFDPDFGGFGPAPKFPPHSGIDFLLNYAIWDGGDPQFRQAAFSAAFFTLRQMALGGIHDHVGGGFHRYGTDPEWRLPHFEKMLYDNALLLSNFARAAVLAEAIDSESAHQFASVVGGIVRWLRDEMRSPDGTFGSAQDADSEGEEGRYYVWTLDAIHELLGPDAGGFIAAFDIQAEGNFAEEATGKRTGANVLVLAQPTEPGQFVRELASLREARARRVAPMRDEKALVGWNGLAIVGLADAGELELAHEAARAILDAESRHGRLPHLIANGQPYGEAYLEDYANFIEGLIRVGIADLTDPDLGEELLRQARRLTLEMLERFGDEAGGFYATGDRHESLFGRTRPVFDQPIPSATSVAIRVLQAQGFEEEATRALHAMVGWMERAPGATEGLYSVAIGFLGARAAAPEEAAEVRKIGDDRVTARLLPREAKAQGDTAKVELRLDIPPGLHLNGNRPPARWLTPTEAKVDGLKAKVTYPETVNDRYEGEVTLAIELALPAGAPEGEYEVSLSFQLCSETECLAPDTLRVDGVVFR